MKRAIQIRQREFGKIEVYDIGDLNVFPGAYVIIEADRGLDYGQILSEAELVLDEKKLKEELPRAVRIADQADINKIKENREKIKEVMKTCDGKIIQHKLNMKLIKGEFSFDCSKIIFYFTAEERIDFRELVKDLAKMFKARIELKQVGVRDEAKILGGFGPCGRMLCCRSFLRDFEPVSIKQAKDQNLPLNPAKISGLCGRLMCCLSYEHTHYKKLSKGLPHPGQKIKYQNETGKVVDVNFLKRVVTVELEDGRHVKVDYNK
ncbi:MAG: stage 0 sporulation family protein [Candidatus Omnitrophota bacterium]